MTRRISTPTKARPARVERARESPVESARFLDFGDGQIYAVTHAARRPRRGLVLLCGSFAIERERAYLTLVRWSRALAARGYEVLRFDYRGHGESTGAFEDMTIRRWRDDAAFCASRLAATARGEGLILHGVRMGALIAAELFASGLGDGMLLWEPPESADALLRDTLRHNLVAQRLSDPGTPPRVREQLIAELEAGALVNVDGYPWSRALWREAQRHPLVLPRESERRPWKSFQARAVGADTFWRSSSPRLVPESDGFFRSSLSWLALHQPWRSRQA